MNGLSGKDDLILTWNKLSDNNNALDVQWDLKNINKEFTVFNIKKFITGSDNIGHWVLIYNNPDMLYYYDPYGIVCPINLLDYLNVDAIACNIKPEQTGGVNCGYYCLTQAWNIINNLKSTRDIVIVTKNKIIDPYKNISETVLEQHNKMLPLYYQQ